MTIKKINLLGSMAVACCALSLSLPAQADLVIDNQTFFPSTSKINNQKGNAQCSNTIPTYGVTAPHTKNTIPRSVIWVACIANLHNCTAEVYMTNNCTGPVIANAVFDINTGIKSLTSLANPDGFVMTDRRPQDAFYIDIMGGPAKLVE